jgi:hypothetical protein
MKENNDILEMIFMRKNKCNNIEPAFAGRQARNKEC